MTLQKVSTGTLIALIMTGLLLTLTTVALVTINRTVQSNGTVSTINVGVYSDNACTQSLSSINWGTIAPGGSTTKTVYVKNTGSIPMTVTMTKANWNPAGANGPVAITWDKEGVQLNINQVATAVLTLRVLPTATGVSSFSVDIVITGAG